MASKVVKDEAERLVQKHAAAAYRIAAELVLLARRSRSYRLEMFRINVAEEVARRLKRLDGQGIGKTIGDAVISKDD